MGDGRVGGEPRVACGGGDVRRRRPRRRLARSHVPGGTLRPVTAEGYYGDLAGASEPAPALNTGVRQRSAETAAQGPEALAAEVGAARERLRVRLAQEPADRLMTVRHQGHTLLLDEYLRTRCVELAVHTEDLALSVSSDVRTPGTTLTAAVDVLVGAARNRHGDAEVLHALARRERDGHDALRVL